MRRWLLISILLIAMTGCAQNPEGPETYGVVFNEAPSLIESHVYYMGERIGEVLESRTGANLAVKLDLAVDTDRRGLLTDSTVFAVSAGRLNLIPLNAYGAPVEPGAVFAGFGSRTALNLFKLRHLLGQTEAAARARAEQMSAGL